jgi:hypothetical protein
MSAPNPNAPLEAVAPIPKKARATAANLIDSLKAHSDRNLLVLLIGQVLDSQAEVRVLQATVNTLLIELCHRQPDSLSQSLGRMGGQRFQELLNQFRNDCNAIPQAAP